jgi:hypothetical protein
MRPHLAIALLGLFAASTAQAAGEVYKWKDDAGVVHYTDAPPDGRSFEKMKTAAPKPAEPAAPAEPAKPAAPAAPPGTAQANCEAARRNVENMERFAEISMDRDGDGTSEKLTPEQREEELRRHRALADLYCTKDTSEG